MYNIVVCFLFVLFFQFWELKSGAFIWGLLQIKKKTLAKSYMRQYDRDFWLWQKDIRFSIKWPRTLPLT